MSDTKLSIAKQVNVGREHSKILRVCGTLTSKQVVSPNGNVSSSQILFSNVALPSLSSSVISKNMRVRYVLQVAATATPPVFNPFAANDAAQPTLVLRQFPLSSVTDTLTATINNVSSTINLRQVLSGYTRVIDPKYLECKASEGPSQCDDNCILTADALLAVDAAPLSNQVFSTYYNGSHTNRGSFEPFVVGTPANSVRYEIVEPVMVSPLTLDDEAIFLANINTFSLQYNMSNTLDMVLTSGQAALPAGLAVSFVSAFLEFDIISLDTRIVSIPRVYMTDYVNPQYFLKDGSAAVGIGALVPQIQIVSDSIRLATMPETIIIYAAPSQASRSATPGRLADAFLQWGSAGATDTGALSIQLNSRQGLLRAASTKELYRMSVRNGYPYSFTTWQKTGGPVIVNTVVDLGLSPENSDIFPQMAGNVILQVTATYNNSNYVNAAVQQGVDTAVNFTPTLTLICMQKGIAMISPDSMALDLGPLSVSEVNAALMSSAKGEAIPEQVVDAFENYGGSLFTKKKGFLSSVAMGQGGAGPEGGVLSAAGLSGLKRHGGRK
jgi:hypothetical protein